MPSATSVNRLPCLASRPAPLTPDLASMMIPSGWISRSFSSGTSGSSAVVVKQPGLATSQLGADRVAIMLGQPVDRLLLQLQRLMRVAVSVLVELRVAQPEIGRQVDDLGSARQRLDDRLRRRMRQAAEHDVQPGHVDVVDLHQRRQVVDRELREDLADRLAGLALGGECSDLGARMIAQQAQQLRPGIAAGTEDADPARSFPSLDALHRTALRSTGQVRPFDNGHSRAVSQPSATGTSAECRERRF